DETLSLAMGINDPDCAPLSSRAETQPKLNPALLRLSAMISQYFMRVQELVARAIGVFPTPYTAMMRTSPSSSRTVLRAVTAYRSDPMKLLSASCRFTAR